MSPTWLRLEALDNPPPVLTKTDGARRYRLGEFGNASPSWDDVNKFYYEAPPGPLYHLRNGSQAGGVTYYNLCWADAVSLWYKQSNPQDFYCSMMCPTEHTIFQGEVCQATPGTGRCGLELYYSTTPKPMREALRLDGKQVDGILALELVKYYLRPTDYEWIMVLLERYKEHVVEFTVLDHVWGTIPGSSCLIWEVRLY